MQRNPEVVQPKSLKPAPLLECFEFPQELRSAYQSIHAHKLKKFFEVCGRWDVENFFLGESIGIDQNNTLQLKLLFYHPNCRSHSFGRFVGVRVGVAPC